MNLIFSLQYADMMEDITGEFYVIENFHLPAFVTDEDGEVKIFPNYQKALEEANDCQDGYVISFARP